MLPIFSQYKNQEANCCPSWSKNTPPRLIEIRPCSDSDKTTKGLTTKWIH